MIRKMALCSGACRKKFWLNLRLRLKYCKAPIFKFNIKLSSTDCFSSLNSNLESNFRANIKQRLKCRMSQNKNPKSSRWSRRSCQLKSAELSHCLSNAHRQWEERKEDTEQPKDNDAPESIVVEGIAVVSLKLAKTSRFLGIHVMS